MLQNTMVKGKVISTVLAVIIGIIILISIFAALVPELNNAGDQLNESNQCDGLSSCIFNATNNSVSPCRDTTNQSVVCASGGNQDVPLGGLFGSNGVVVLIVLALLIIIVFGILIGRMKMKQ